MIHSFEALRNHTDQINIKMHKRLLQTNRKSLLKVWSIKCNLQMQDDALLILAWNWCKCRLLKAMENIFMKA